MTPLRHLNTDDGETRKTLWRLFDGTLLESVLMRYPGRATLCISSQAGCGMACPFCATGQGGLDRNLSVGEMVEQVRHAAAAMRDGEVEGEKGACPISSSWAWASPLPTTSVLSIPSGRSPRHHQRVRYFAAQCDGLDRRFGACDPQTADEGMTVRLAVSLHTPDDELRDELVPVNNRWSVDEVLDAARYYADTSGRRVSIEYALIRDMNDQPWRADLLGKKLRGALGSKVHVNVIPLNPTPGSKWDASPKAVQDEFVRRVEAQGVPCTVRDTKGQEIAAACGQLAAEEDE